MTNEQRQHLKHLMLEQARKLSDKYERGTREHGTLLTDASVIELLDNAIDEAIDQFAYLQTARDNYIKENEDATRILRGL